MLGLALLDIGVIFFYFVLLMIIGIWSSRAVKNTSDFFVGGRRFGSFITMMLNFGSGTHADQAVAVISKIYQVGLAGIWYQWLYLFVTPFYWVIGPIMRRLRVVTTADYFHKRYGLSVATLYAIMAIITLMQSMGLMLQSSGRIIEGITVGAIPFYVSVLVMTALFVVYGMAGGIISAAITDVLQGLCTIVMSFMLLPFAISAVGGFKGLHTKLSGASHDLFSLVTPGEITIFFITVAVVNGLIGWPVQAHAMTVSSSTRTEMSSRIGVTYGNFIKRFCTVAWAFVGLSCIALFPTLKNPDLAFGEAARLLLPTGFIGLLIATVVASVQSGCSAFMITGSGIFTRNIYRVFFDKGNSEAYYLLVGRIASLIIVLGGLALAYFIPGVVKSLELFWQVPAFMGIPFFMGLMWRRANSKAVWASFIATTVVFLGCETGLFTGHKIPLAWQMFWYLVAGLVVGIVVSLITKPQQKEVLDKFYTELNTPVDIEEHLASDLSERK
jgi:Na+/proline symporter